MKLSRLFRESVTLRDGRRVTMRAIRPEDAPLLVDLHDRLSIESRYLRFFGPKPVLSGQEAAYLANVDFDRRFAIVASAREDGVERIVAVGRFDVGEDGTAEAAVVVRDDYQRQGLGRALLERMLEIARGRGVATFTGEVLAENEAMLSLLSTAGLELAPPRDGVVQVSTSVEDVPLAMRLLKLLAEQGEALRLTVDLVKRRRA